MIISLANSIRFKHEPGGLPNFDNVLEGTQPWPNSVLNDYCQNLFYGQSITIQFRCNVGEVPTCSLYLDDGSEVIMTMSQKAIYTDFETWEFTFSTSTYQGLRGYFRATSSGNVGKNVFWVSEPMIFYTNGDASKRDHLFIEYYNFDNAFQMDYSTDIVGYLFIPGLMKDYASEGEITTYSNQGILTKLAETVQRAIEFQGISIPAYLAEIISIAMAHDKLYVNYVEFTSKSKPTIENTPMFNLVNLNCLLTRSELLGRNSNDIGEPTPEEFNTFDGNIFIGRANSIIFVRLTDWDEPSFGNTFFNERPFFNHILYSYCQHFYSTDIASFQVRSKIGIVPIVTILGTPIDIYKVFSDSDGDYWQCDVDMSTVPQDSSFQIKVVGAGTEYESEPILIIEENRDDLQLEWYNFDNAFDIYYVDGITMLMRLPGIIKEYSVTGELIVYDNLGELTKLKEIINRNLLLQTGEVPDYLVEQIALAAAHDKFFVNEVEYVSSDKPSISSTGMTNFKTLELDLQQRNVLGINTNDIGYVSPVSPTTYDVIVKEKLNVFGQFDIVIDPNYLTHTCTIIYKGGIDVLLIAGSTPGGNDLIYGVRPSPTKPNLNQTVSIHIDEGAASTVYFTITGTNALLDVIIQTIINRDLT